MSDGGSHAVRPATRECPFAELSSCPWYYKITTRCTAQSGTCRIVSYDGLYVCVQQKGFTPLHIAAKYGNVPISKILLSKGASPNAEGKNGLTPLHVATHYNSVEVAQLLMEHKANPHAAAKVGHMYSVKQSSLLAVINIVHCFIVIMYRKCQTLKVIYNMLIFLEKCTCNFTVVPLCSGKVTGSEFRWHTLDLSLHTFPARQSGWQFAIENRLILCALLMQVMSVVINNVMSLCWVPGKRLSEPSMYYSLVCM